MVFSLLVGVMHITQLLRVSTTCLDHSSLEHEHCAVVKKSLLPELCIYM